MELKLFRIKIEHEAFIVANNEQEALEEFWDNGDLCGESLSEFVDDATTVNYIDEAEELLEE